MVNKVILIGNLGADPEVRYTQTEWHRVVAWGRLGEICGEYLNKGSKVYIEGRIETRKWQDKDGNDRYNTEIITREMKMLSPRGAGNGGGSGRQQYDDEPPMPEEPPMGNDVPF